ncbi:hypothetical protein B0H14DRAFT_2635455 [Mycena olivaceomarginata]|nr:hypothetical protein B0H14DRAFT_2635455 [Mycena olivaceomarginata]
MRPLGCKERQRTAGSRGRDPEEPAEEPHCCFCSPRAAAELLGLALGLEAEIALDWKSVLVHEQVRLVLLQVSAAHKETGKRMYGDPHSVALAAAVEAVEDNRDDGGGAEPDNWLAETLVLWEAEAALSWKNRPRRRRRRREQLPTSSGLHILLSCLLRAQTDGRLVEKLPANEIFDEVEVTELRRFRLCLSGGLQYYSSLLVSSGFCWSTDLEIRTYPVSATHRLFFGWDDSRISKFPPTPKFRGIPHSARVQACSSGFLIGSAYLTRSQPKVSVKRTTTHLAGALEVPDNDQPISGTEDTTATRPGLHLTLVPKGDCQCPINYMKNFPR